MPSAHWIDGSVAVSRVSLDIVAKRNILTASTKNWLLSQSKVDPLELSWILTLSLSICVTAKRPPICTILFLPKSTTHKKMVINRKCSNWKATSRLILLLLHEGFKYKQILTPVLHKKCTGMRMTSTQPSYIFIVKMVLKYVLKVTKIKCSSTRAYSTAGQRILMDHPLLHLPSLPALSLLYPHSSPEMIQLHVLQHYTRGTSRQAMKEGQGDRPSPLSSSYPHSWEFFGWLKYSNFQI